MMKIVVIFFVALVSLISAHPVLVEDEQGQQYYLEVEQTPVLIRRMREEPKLPGPNDPKMVGQYGANRYLQQGVLSYRNPEGSGIDIGHQDMNGFGNNQSLHGIIPIWSNNNADIVVNQH